MAQLIRPLMLWPMLRRYCYSLSPLSHLLAASFPQPCSHRRWFAVTSSRHRNLQFRSRGLRLPNAPPPSGLQEGYTSDSDPLAKKSRNQKKREARRAVQWGMDLASFSTPQIKRILKAASLDGEVFDAIMLVKRLGPDVREGKRRQFNYIGKLLREAPPELMDGLIEATKVGDYGMLHALSAPASTIVDDNEEAEYEEEDEVSSEFTEIASRWFDGLINKDIKITNEVYSLRSVDFDRQELRKLVRKAHAVQEQKSTDGANDEDIDRAIKTAETSLTRFLRALAKRIPSQ